MYALTPFQFLPSHIVRLVANYVVGYSDSRRFRDMKLLRPLLYVCHNMRAITLPLYFGFFRLTLASSVSNSPMEPKRRESKDLDHPARHLARYLEIELNEVDIYSGRALQMLLCEPYDGCLFPLARQVAFTIGLGECIWAEQSVVAANISAFVQHIKQTAPVANTYQLSTKGPRVVSPTMDNHFDDLTTQLFRLVGQIEYYHSCANSLELQLDGVCNLVRIRDITTGHNSSTFTRLARRNALTLESLEINLSSTSGFADTIQDTDGVYVTYPRLTTLFLGGGMTASSVPPPVFKDIVPFPSLRCLTLSQRYPFGDDVFFRGNAATLEHLSLWLGISTVAALREYRLFTPQSHPSLQRVTIRCFGDITPDAFTSKADALRFVLSIGTQTAVRVTNIPVTGAELIGVTTSLSNYASIQVLSLSRTSLDLWQVVALVKSLLLLSDLSTAPPVIGTLPDGIVLSELPAYVVTTFAPMGPRFRHWRIVSHHDNDMGEDNVKCLLFLALVCPNFTYATTLFSPRRGLNMEMLERAIASDMFKPYAQRLQRFRYLDD
ncbi:hypothetical protein GGH93_000279 [Coemansia aciculifera]|nr:hypothetical protein GGH93_000279 [Coemansia aciculifera]